MESLQDFETILHSLDHHLKTIPDHVQFIWVDRECKETNQLTYSDLDEQSNAVAYHLLKLGLAKGDRVMIAYPFGLEFLAGMFGAMKIGVIPCSVYPPNPGQLKTAMKQFRGFVEDSGAKFALSTTAFSTAMKAASMFHKSGVKWIGTDNLKSPKTYEWKQNLSTPTADDVAFIQYTSGSTGTPKGVLVGHRALVENAKAVNQVSDYPGPGATTVLWLPQYHDMGLIGGFMTHLYIRVRCVFASPIDFISRPLLWDDMVQRYKADFTSAPNFAYALLLKRLKQANRKADWSYMRRAYFGAEPTQARVIEQLVTELQVKRENIYNLYGLAEAVVMLAGGPAVADEEGIVSSGPAESDTVKLRIVDNALNQVVKDGQVGNIWAQSIRLANGYYGKEALTASAFGNTLPGESGHWLDTGDLGKIVNGTLYATGRAKDVIIVQGKNRYPTDIERSVEEAFHDVLRPGRSAAFQIGDAKIGITTEARNVESVRAKSSELTMEIRKHILQEHGLPAEVVLVLAPNANPKTTSGKLRRFEIKRRTVEHDWKAKDVLMRSENIQPSICAPPMSTLSTKDVTEPTEDFSQCDESLTGDCLPVGPLHEEGKVCQLRGSDAAARLATILSEILDTVPVMNKSWVENGLSSVSAAELSNRCQQEFHLEIPLNFQELYPTPNDLKCFLLSTMGTPFEQVDCNHDKTLPSNLTKASFSLLQGMGIAVLLLLVAASLLPSYFIGQTLSSLTISIQIGDSQRYAAWGWLPLVVPAFLLTFTMVVILCKYLLIGTYQSQTIPFLSRQYLAWWFVDRLLDLWELFVGQFLLETKFLWAIYRLLGADISPSASLSAFIREFDLVSIGPRSNVAHATRCRKFRFEDDLDCPLMCLRPISVGSDSKVSGFLGPGCRVGNKCKIESLSAAEEGAIIPDHSVAIGCPAYLAGHNEEERKVEWFLDFLKLIWTIVEIYLYFSLFLAAQVAVNQQLPPGWRYTPLLYWCLLLLLTALFGVIISIPMKWVFIGKRASMDRQENTWKQFANWACDYHFRLAQLTLEPLTGASRFWIVVLKLMGMDIDFASTVNTYSMFVPSNVDLITIHRSFISAISVDVSNGNGRIEIVDSSVGYMARIHSGVKVMRSLVPPRATLRESLYDSNEKAAIESKTLLVMEGIGNELGHVAIALALFGAFIPAYEVFVNTIYRVPTAVTVPCIAVAILTHCLSMHALSRVVEAATFLSPPRIQRALFLNYIMHTWASRNWSLLCLIYGTRAVPVWLRLMGAEVQGEVWLFGQQLYDISRLHFIGTQSLLDGSNVHCHHFVRGEMVTIADTHIHNALLHPSCYAYAGSSIPKGEHAPFTIFGGSKTNANVATPGLDVWPAEMSV